MQEILRGGLSPTKLEKDVAGSSNVTLTLAEVMNGTLGFEGILTGNITVTLPLLEEDAGLIYCADNETTGSFTLGLKTAASGTLDLPQGACLDVLWNGTAFEFLGVSSPTLDAAIADVSFTSTARGDIIRRGAAAWNNLVAKDSGKILVGDGTDVVSVAVSGDATLSAAGAVALSSALVQVAAVSLTAAQILDLADTPVQLVAAPAAGSFLELVSAELLLDHAGTGFTETADNLEIHYENEAGAAATGVIEMTGFIDQTADTVLHVLPLAPVARAATAIVAKALVLTNINDDFVDGGTTTSVLRVRTAYRVHPSGF